eukprot:TRINITY_DN31050_c0_g1_i1.p1 TRINITY_DN31050_c0_g1~~TRINITY_DN31050_c0_g1_i1.p1  ORF type:complete len:688 (+),score=214.47 TRINITY_DN31050_c0_g1_i1:89-2065(+)
MAMAWDLSSAAARRMLMAISVAWLLVWAVVLSCAFTPAHDGAFCTYIADRHSAGLLEATFCDPTLLVSLILMGIWWFRVGAQIEFGIYAAALVAVLWVFLAVVTPLLLVLVIALCLLAYVLYLPILPFHAARDVRCALKVPAALASVVAWAAGGALGVLVLALAAGAALVVVAVGTPFAPFIYQSRLPGAGAALRFFLKSSPGALISPLQFTAIMWVRHPHLWWTRLLCAVGIVASVMYAVSLRYALSTLIVPAQLLPPVPYPPAGWSEGAAEAEEAGLLPFAAFRRRIPVRFFLNPPDAKHEQGKRWLLCLLGSGERLCGGASAVRTARMVQRHAGGRPVALLVCHYRGCASAPGAPMEGRDLVTDARACYRWLTDTQGVPPEHIAISGFSIGGAVATLLAADVDHPGPLLCDRTFSALMRVPLRWAMHAPVERVHTRIVQAEGDDELCVVTVHEGAEEAAKDSRWARWGDRLGRFVARETAAVGASMDWALDADGAMRKWLAADPAREEMLTVMWHPQDSVIPEEASLKNVVPERCVYQLLGGSAGMGRFTRQDTDSALRVAKEVGKAHGGHQVLVWEHPTHILPWLDDEHVDVTFQVEGRCTLPERYNRATAEKVYKRLCAQLWGADAAHSAPGEGRRSPRASPPPKGRKGYGTL